MTFKTGVIIGKFCPLHTGHLELIQYARLHCDHLYVLIVDRPDRAPYNEFPVEHRRGWFHYENNIIVERERFTPVILKVDSEFPDIDHERWALATIKAIDCKPDALFSQEYERDKDFAMAMGAAFIVPPIEVKVHATMIREAPTKYMQYLPPKVRAFYQNKGVKV